MDSSRRVYLILLLLVAIWCSTIVAAPFLQTLSDQTKPVATLIYKFFARICHQIDERSFHLYNEKFAVCIRCTSIYFAFLAGLLLYPFVRTFKNLRIPPLGWLIASSIPMLLDVLLSVAGVHFSTATTRVITGALFGSLLPLYILPPLFESIMTLSQRLTSKGEPLYARKTE